MKIYPAYLELIIPFLSHLQCLSEHVVSRDSVWPASAVFLLLLHSYQHVVYNKQRRDLLCPKVITNSVKNMFYCIVSCEIYERPVHEILVLTGPLADSHEIKGFL